MNSDVAKIELSETMVSSKRNRDLIVGSTYARSLMQTHDWLTSTGHFSVLRRPYRGHPGKTVIASLSGQHGQPEPSSVFRKLVHLGSYNYSGLNDRLEIRTVAIKAINDYGLSTSGVRLLNGTNELHLELEHRLAKFLGMEACLTYSSGFSANVSMLGAVCSEKDIILSDELNHQSIVDGIKISQAQVVKFRHRDSEHLRGILKGISYIQRKFIVTDGVFSMDGDIARLDELVEIAEEFNSFLVVDDAHATAAIGPNGRGTAALFGLESKIDIIIGSLSKGLPGIGGFAAGSRRTIELLGYGSNGYLFSASLPPSVTAGLIAAIDTLEREPELQVRLHENEHRLRSGIRNLGLDVMHSETPIIPILVPSREIAFRFARLLHEEGVFANPVCYPAVARTKSRLRLNATAILEKDEIDMAIDAIASSARKLGLIERPAK